MRYLGLAAIGIAWLAATGPSLAQNGGDPRVAAHRGGSLLWPENSLLAFKNAIALGADYIEFDVHLSSDGEVVVIHDPTLDRTTTGRGPVRDQSVAELKTMHLKDRTGTVTAEAVPLLDEVAVVAAQGRRRMLLEIKVDDRGRRYPGIEEKVLAILDRRAMASSTVVMAFEEDTWRRVHALRPEITVGALYSPRTLSSAGSTAVRAVSEAGAEGARFVGLQETLVGPDTIAAAQRAGVLLGVWTVNTEDALRRFIDQRVGVLITDRPDLAKSLLTR